MYKYMYISQHFMHLCKKKVYLNISIAFFHAKKVYLYLIGTEPYTLVLTAVIEDGKRLWHNVNRHDMLLLGLWEGGIPNGPLLFCIYCL